MITANKPSDKPRRFILLLVFFTGFSFLQLEVSWFRMLTLVTGATVSATTLVLAAFMGGFGTGGWFWSRRIAPSAKPGRILAVLTGGVTLFALASIPLMNNALTALYSASWLPGALSRLIVPAIAWLTLFIPAFFMGGVLPLAATAYLSNDRSLHSGMGSIYGWETLGSTLGGLIAGFLLIGIAGQNGTVLIAAVINGLLAITLVLLPWPATTTDAPASAETFSQIPKKEKKKAESLHPSGNRHAALITAFITGFSVIGLQVVWFRIFRIYMTNSAYTFSLIAAMVIVGLSAGSALYSRRGQRVRDPRKMMQRLLMFMAAVSLAGFALLSNLPALVMFPFESLSETHAIRILLIPFLSALLIIVPVTILSGYLFPLACTTHAGSRKAIGRSIGSVLLTNTAGNVLGPLLAAFVLIPLVGAGLSVVIFGALLMAAAAFTAGTNTARNLAGAVAMVLLIICIAAPRVKILPPSFSRFPKEILAYNESTGGTFVVGAENKKGNRVLSTYVNNSAVIGSTYDAIKVVKMVGHLPFFAGLQCHDVLVVGFGIGVTTSAVASHPEVKSIDCVELVAGLKEAAHFYSDLNHGIEKDPRLKVHNGDGRHFLQTTRRKFDLITTDPTHPILGSASLYTREYFELCRSHLNPGGMISQYLPLHKLLPEDFKGIIKTFRTVFPECTIWLGHYHAVLLGFTGKAEIDFRRWSERMANMQPDMWFYNNPYALASCLSLDAMAIDQFNGNSPLLTDNFPYTEYCSLRSFDAANLPANLAFMNNNREAVNRVFINIPDPALMQHYIEGNRLMTGALGKMLQGDRNGFMQTMQEAVLMNPGNDELRFMMQLNMN